MKFNKIIFITLLCLVLLGGVNSAFAQEETPSASYVVQTGDTLYAIALRFGLLADDIITANGLTNPNQVYVGDELILPGVDWVSGVLDFTGMPLGETFRSILRRNQFDPIVIARLNGLVSSGHAYVGYPILAPVDQLLYADNGRIALAQEQSLFEQAILNGVNPWSLTAANQLRNPNHSFPGDVMLLPGSENPGPGALPSPISVLETAYGNFEQGRTTIIRLDTGDQALLSLNGAFTNQPLIFFLNENGDMVTILGTHAMLTPGVYPLEIIGELEGGGTFEYSARVGVPSGSYGYETISVDPAYVNDSLSETETEFIRQMAVVISPERYWTQAFVAPTPYTTNFTSVFGTRRSFNGSPFNYYHSGLDYGGGVGVEIFATAPGLVVFSGPLDIRGNATLINHGWGVYTGYWHQSEIFVQVGDFVEAGQVIGLVGNTGRSSGAHLHFEILLNGVPVDPLEWLTYYFP